MERISLEEAGRLLCENAKETASEELPIEEAAGRILAKDVRAVVTQPPFDRSAMDGYALRSEDTKGAKREQPVSMRVIDQICAGEAAGQPIHPGEAVRVMTGGMIPEGADCVVRQEDTDYGEEAVRVYCEAVSMQNYCPAGEDFYAGEVLAQAGVRVDAALAAMAAAAGKMTLCVRKRPKVAVITTGDELCLPGQPLRPGQIYDSNLTYLVVRLRQMGCEICMSVAAGDELEKICDALEEAVAEADFVITTGGVSVGQKDLLPEVMKKMEARVLFHGIQIKPGMPTMFSVMKGVPVLSLSGNPFAASAVFEFLLPPYLAVCQGKKAERADRYARMENDVKKASPIRRLLRGRCDGDKVQVPGVQKNSQLRAGIGCNCLVDIPAGNQGLREGDIVKMIPFEGEKQFCF